jgi:alkylated DNA repair dioxygenase AlkB
MQQQELILAPVGPVQPTATVPGFSLRNDYITPDDEGLLLEQIDRQPWETDWRRRIQQYGLGYSEMANRPSWLRDFPAWLKPLAERVGHDAQFTRFPENCVINEYIPPLGIGPHTDYAAFGPAIACVSLGSDVVMDFTGPGEPSKVSVHVPRRSLWIITGHARSVWRHGIAPRLTDLINGERRSRSRRVSITFRTAAAA